MKSLVLKDLYNIAHNVKSLLFSLVVLSVAFVSSSGVAGYVCISAILCSMMIVTTFIFDDNSKWTRYAMIMPVSRRNLIAAKFITLAIFCMAGCLFGLVLGPVVAVLMKKGFFDPAGIGELLFTALVAWAVAFVFGSMSIPLVIRFGAERGRMLILVSFLLPAAIVYGLYRLLLMAGVVLTEQHINFLLYSSPIIALAWGCFMLQISYWIFSAQEL